jgi:hypothetical protein
LGTVREVPVAPRLQMYSNRVFLPVAGRLAPIEIAPEPSWGAGPFALGMQPSPKAEGNRLRYGEDHPENPLGTPKRFAPSPVLCSDRNAQEAQKFPFALHAKNKRPPSSIGKAEVVGASTDQIDSGLWSIRW